MLLIAKTNWQANETKKCSIVPKAACLCQPEALNLDLPEVQVKHRHNDLFLEQTEDVNLPPLAGACKITELSSAHTIATSVYMHHPLAWIPAAPYQICSKAAMAQQASTLQKRCRECSYEAIAAVDAALT